MRIIFFLFCIHFSSEAVAEISAKAATISVQWLSIASVAIDDGKTKILFDPVWTRPGLFHWLGVMPLRSDENLVKKMLKKYHLQNIRAIFASHSHHDHVVDAPLVSKISGATFYTDASQKRIALAYDDSLIKTQTFVPAKKIHIGDFSITPLLRDHAKIFDLFHFLPGDVPAQTNLNLWDYHVGKTWFYLIEHPLGCILLDQGSRPKLDSLPPNHPPIDMVIQGIANRKSDEDLMNGYVGKLAPKMFIPLHFDHFFFFRMTITTCFLEFI